MEPCTHPRRISINAKCKDMCSVGMTLNLVARKDDAGGWFVNGLSRV
jgi:hypothetical protein